MADCVFLLNNNTKNNQKCHVKLVKYDLIKRPWKWEKRINFFLVHLDKRDAIYIKLYFPWTRKWFIKNDSLVMIRLSIFFDSWRKEKLKFKSMWSKMILCSNWKYIDVSEFSLILFLLLRVYLVLHRWSVIWFSWYNRYSVESITAICNR